MNDVQQLDRGKAEYFLSFVLLVTFRLSVPIFNYFVRAEMALPSFLEPFLYLLLLAVPYKMYRWMVGGSFAVLGIVGAILIAWSSLIIVNMEEPPIAPWLLICLVVFSIIEMLLQTCMGIRLLYAENLVLFLERRNTREILD